MEETLGKVTTEQDQDIQEPENKVLTKEELKKKIMAIPGLDDDFVDVALAVKKLKSNILAEIEKRTKENAQKSEQDTGVILKSISELEGNIQTAKTNYDKKIDSKDTEIKELKTKYNALETKFNNLEKRFNNATVKLEF